MTPPALRGIRAAFVLLTRIPLGGFPYRSADWRWADAYFPLVGAVVGLIAAGVWYGCGSLGSWPAAILAVIVSVLLTGAFHEDGLADTSDAVGGGLEDRDRVLEILKDSRLGTYGSTALFMALLLRIALIERLDHDDGLALVFSHCLGRTPMVAIRATLPYVTRGDQAKSRGLEGGGPVQVAVAFASSLVIGLVCVEGLAELVLAFGAVLAVGAFMAWRFHRRVGGLTGDFMGATEQICEITILMVAVGMRT